jgi:hypothetical protein
MQGMLEGVAECCNAVEQGRSQRSRPVTNNNKGIWYWNQEVKLGSSEKQQANFTTTKSDSA